MGVTYSGCKGCHRMLLILFVIIGLIKYKKMYYAVLQEFRFPLPDRAKIAQLHLVFQDRPWLKLWGLVPMCQYRKYFIKIVLTDGQVLHLPIGFHQKHKARMAIGMFAKRTAAAAYIDGPYGMQALRAMQAGSRPAVNHLVI